jgi:outer membrane receptor protein involved in Fe transport
MISNEMKECSMKRSMRRLRAAMLLCAAVMVLGVMAWGGVAKAQTFRGTILGTVTDTSGQAIAGAAVKVKNLGTGLERIVTTTEDGGYSVPELPIGSYSVTVEKAGFKAGVVTGIQVEVSSERRVDVALQVGEVAQTVEVQGDTLPQVDSTENTLGGIIESKVVTNLPVNGRDYQKLIFLVPGVTGSPDQITDSPGSLGTFSVNGARGRANNFLLDGTDMNDGYRNDPAINEAGVFGTPATILPLEAIAELHVESNFAAEYGRSAGGVINIVTKSGTNELHGSGFEFLRNTVADARNYFNDVGTPKGVFQNNQYGGSLSGPIRKDRTFFFVDYEGLREKGIQSFASCVPTAADITNNTPAGGVNPVIAALLAAGKGWPTPTGAGSCIVQATDVIQQASNPSNTELATPFTNRVDSGIIKIDHQINKDNLLTGRYYLGDSDQSFPLALVGGGSLPNYNTLTPTRVQLISISYVTTLSPSAINEARLGWNRFAEGFFPQDTKFDPASIGLVTGATGFDLGLPEIKAASFPQLGSSASDPRHRVDANWHYIDNVSWKAGRHDIRFGYEFRRSTISQLLDVNFRGTLKFSTFMDFLGGMPTGGSIQSSPAGSSTDRNTFQNSHAIYLQDSFHARKNVTLNLGVRYDYYGLFQEKHGNLTNVDPITGAPIIVGQGRLYQPDYTNVSPRVSVAWDLTGKGKTVVRAGYGIFYDAYSQDQFLAHLPFNSAFDPGVAYSGFGPNPVFIGSPVGQLVSGSAAFSGGVPIGDAFGVDQHLRTPYMQNFNLNLQQELTRHMVFQIGYVGSNGHKLLRFRDLNQPTLAQIQQTNYTANSIALDANFPANPNVPGCGCVPKAIADGFLAFNYEEASANSNYHSLQASLRVNDWHGVTSTANYVWSHSIDDASDGEDFVPNASQPDNSQGPIAGNRGNSNFDVRNRFTWNFIYQLPTLSSHMKRLTGGWGVNGVVTIQSGQPFHLNYNFEDDFNGSGEGFARPDVVGPIVYNQSDPRNYLNLTAFAVPCTLAGGTGAGNCQLINPATGANCTAQGIGPNCINSQHFGNEGRNSLIGPHFRQFDFSVFKMTPITERLKLELRLEAYNLLNHPNFANPYLPNFIADAAPNGINTNGTSIGTLGLGSTGDVGIGYPFLGSGGPRTLQLAAKFTF